MLFVLDSTQINLFLPGFYLDLSCTRPSMYQDQMKPDLFHPWQVFAKAMQSTWLINSGAKGCIAQRLLCLAMSVAASAHDSPFTVPSFAQIFMLIAIENARREGFRKSNPMHARTLLLGRDHFHVRDSRKPVKRQEIVDRWMERTRNYRWLYPERTGDGG